MKIDGLDVPDSMIQAETRRLFQVLEQRVAKEELTRHADNVRGQACRLALGRFLLLAEAERQGITISPAEIEEDLDRVRRGYGSQQEFEERLRMLDITPDALRQTIVEARQVDELTRRLAADVDEPGEAELQAFYDEHVSEFDEPAAVRVRHIMIRADKPDAAARLNAMREQLAAQSVSFEELAMEYSECPSGREAGGDLGWIRPGQFDADLEEAAFALDQGCISLPVKSRLGFHLLQVDARQEARSVSYGEARDQIRERLLGEARNAVVMEAIQSLHKAALQGGSE